MKSSLRALRFILLKCESGRGLADSKTEPYGRQGMATRREILTGGLKIGAAVALSQIGIAPDLLAQAPAQPDEMTRNSAPQRAVFPQPDFGPAPKILPKE